MRSTTDDRTTDDVTALGWTTDAVVTPLRAVASDMVVLAAFVGIGFLVGTISTIHFISNRLKG